MQMADRLRIWRGRIIPGLFLFWALLSFFPVKAVEDTSVLAEFTEASLENASPAIADRKEIAQRYYGIGVIEMVSSAVPRWEIGEVSNFYVINTGELATLEIQAKIVFIGEHVVYWLDTRETGLISQSITSSFTEFDQLIYPKMVEIFGPEASPGIDNDPKIHVVFTRAVGRGILGYFSSRDSESMLTTPFSNEKEMFFLNASMLRSNPAQITNTLTHEFQHMIHHAHDANEDSLIDEGLSGLAEFLMENRLSDAYEREYLSKPDIPLLYWPLEGSLIGHYGGAFLFMKYFYDQYGIEGLMALVREPANGLQGIDAVLSALVPSGMPADGDELFGNFMLALLASRVGVILPEVGFKGENPLFAKASLSTEPLPCQETEILAEAEQFGIDGYSLRCPDGKYQISIEADAISQLLSEKPFRGNFAWWNVAANNSIAYMEHDYDLQNSDGEIWLEFAIWQDIEPEFDYLYVLVSTDGSQHWEVLTPTGCSTVNDSGFNLGCGYTGRSPNWRVERVDLSAYAGKEITLRFEMITDQAVLGEGVLIDEIRIPAIGFYDGAGLGSSGWRTEGFARISGTIPQPFSLVTITGSLSSPRTEVVRSAPPLAQNFLCDFNTEDNALCEFALSPINRYARTKAGYRITISRID